MCSFDLIMLWSIDIINTSYSVCISNRRRKKKRRYAMPILAFFRYNMKKYQYCTACCPQKYIGGPSGQLNIQFSLYAIQYLFLPNGKMYLYYQCSHQCYLFPEREEIKHRWSTLKESWVTPMWISLQTMLFQNMGLKIRFFLHFWYILSIIG